MLNKEIDIIHDKYVATMALTNIISSLELLKSTESVYKTDYRVSMVCLIEETVSRLVFGLTDDTETGIGEILLDHAKAIIEQCQTGMDFGKTAIKALANAQCYLIEIEKKVKESKN